MSNDFLVVEPGLTYLVFGQRLKAAELAQAQSVFGADAFSYTCYTQKLQRQLRVKAAEESARLAQHLQKAHKLAYSK